jgi:hypothetical protein
MTTRKTKSGEENERQKDQMILQAEADDCERLKIARQQ